MTRIHGFETEDIAEKCAVRLGVLTVDNYVSTRDHCPSEEVPGFPIRPHLPWPLEKPIGIRLGHYQIPETAKARAYALAALFCRCPALMPLSILPVPRRQSGRSCPCPET